VRIVEPPPESPLPLDAALCERKFEELVATHTVVLTAIATRLVGGNDAGDVVQEALLRAWRRWSTFDPSRGTVRGWLAAIVVDRARRHLRRLARSGTPGVLDVSGRPPHEADLAQRLVVEGAVRSLPRRQREVVVLFYLADLSIEQTARALGVRPGTVKAHLAAARARLKSEMEGS
jgi:RNA polymerase sigma-70 factor (ECF subfamily)